MKTPQAGIFALGTAAHAYLEFDVLDKRNGENLVAAIAAMRDREPPLAEST
jgi:porphyrinogen peroxidase